MSLTATLRSQENNDMPGSAVEIVVAGTPVVCDRMGVAFLEKSRLLVVSDLHLRMLLGEDAGPLKKEFAGRAERAIAAFLALYGVENVRAGA